MGRFVLPAVVGFALSLGACVLADEELSVGESALSSACFDTGDGVLCASEDEVFVEVDDRFGLVKNSSGDSGESSDSSDSGESSDSSDSGESSDSSESGESSASDSESSEAVDPALTGTEDVLGTPEGIDFRAGGYISHILLGVDELWVGAGTHSLAIDITGLNGGFKLHGTETIAVDDMVVFDTEAGTAFVVADWTADLEPKTVNEIYSVCVQVIVNGNFVGPVKCQDYGPF